MSYRIKTVASLTGISPTTLRAWERRYDVVEPRRSESGYRVYSDVDVATLSRVKQLVDHGLKAGEAIALVRRGMQAPSPGDLPPEGLSALRTRLLAALLLFDRNNAAQTYRGLVAVPQPRQVDEVLLPLMVEVGSMWAGANCSIAQEHFASGFVREKLIAMLDAASGIPLDGPEAICVGVREESHELGLLAAAVHLSLRGWRVTYLGLDLPLAEIERVAHERRPALLCTSVIRSRSAADCLLLAAGLRCAAPAETAVVVGGRGLPDTIFDFRSGGVHFLRTIKELPDVAG